MIDAVIAWVNGADPAHSRKRMHYADDTEIPKTEAAGFLSTRFNALDEIRYCIYLIRKNAPWIDNIHLITDNQRPEWLDASTQKSLNVKIVDHRHIFAGFEKHLPTFNSISIESVLHKVPGLAERFIYFNDDFFIIKPTKLSDFFDGNIPRIRGKPLLRYKPLRKLLPKFRNLSAMPVGMVGIRQGTWEEVPRFVLNMVMTSHAPYPILKKDFAAMMESNNRIEKNTQYRFRNQNQFVPIGLYATLGRYKRQVRLIDPDGLYLSPEIDVSPEAVISEAKNGNKYHLCVQSLDAFDPADRKKVSEFLDSALL